MRAHSPEHRGFSNLKVGLFLIAPFLLSACGGGSSHQGQLSMTTARAEHTATLLSDGKVLIAGGFGDGFRQLPSAELYDPSSGAFTPTGDMTTARARHTATLLANGKVLIAGGVIDTQQGTYLVSAEIYDPSTGTFTATGKMISSGIIYSTLLPDGRVLVGDDGNAEIYDPSTGAFALTGPYADGLLGDMPTLLPNGRVLVGATELFDPKTDTFSATGTRQPAGAPTPDGFPATATLLMNGTVLFVEGNEDAFPDEADIYDPASGTFTYIGRTHFVHEFSTATHLPDGTVLIAGGQLAGGSGSTAVELFDPATATFAPTADLTTGRHEHTATLLPDGTVLITGGYNTWTWPTASAEIYKK
jgi:Galactose oxidase, central domain/Kelch motif